MIFKMTGNIMIAQQSISEGFFSLFFFKFKTTARREFQPKYTEGETLPTLSTEIGFHRKGSMNPSFSREGIQL